MIGQMDDIAHLDRGQVLDQFVIDKRTVGAAQVFDQS